MSKKFGGFLGSSSGTPGVSPIVPRNEGRMADYVAIAKAARSTGRTSSLHPAKPCFAIALDATGSMDGLISDARQNIGKILDKIYAEAKTQVRVRIYAYRDYDVSHALCDCSELTGDPQVLSRWLASVRTHGGGANPGEAVETALEAIYAANEVSAVLLAGDEPSNVRASLNAHNRHENATAREWAPKFAAKGIPIHTFVVGDRQDTKTDFAAIAKLSGGQSGHLDGSDAMIHMAVMAMLARLSGADAVNQYGKNNALSIAARDFSQRLISGPK